MKKELIVWLLTKIERGKNKVREYIVFSGREHHNSLGIVRTLGESGIEPIYVVVKGGPVFVSKSKYIKQSHYVDTVEEGIELIISTYSDSSNKSFILVEDDWTVAVMDKYYDRLKNNFYFFNASGKLSEFFNKDTVNEMVVKYGLKVPKTWRVKVGDIPSDIEYPIMTKAVNSIGEEWKDIVFICQDARELNDAFLKMRSEYVLVQQYIEKVDEVSFDAFSVNAGKDTFIVMEASQMYNIPDKYSPYWKIQNYRNTDVGERIKKIIEEIGFEGIFEFEFMVDKDGNYWFLEINFRNTALGYATTVAGMPQVIMWCDAMEKGYIDHSKRVEIPNGMRAMAECFDYDVRVKGGIISKEEWLKEYMTAECKMYMGRDDFEPFRYFMEYKKKYMC